MKISSSDATKYAEDQEVAEAALAGEDWAVSHVKNLVMDGKLTATLVKRGASADEAKVIVSDLLGDCFGGERASGGMHRLLGRYNGKGQLGAFLNRAALNRLISFKRSQKSTVTIEDEANENSSGIVLTANVAFESEDAVVQLLKEAIQSAFSEVDQEKLVLFRLNTSYAVKRNKLAETWGWDASKVTRQMASLLDEIKEKVQENLRQSDPWLELEWEDFISVCGESIDLFDY